MKLNRLLFLTILFATVQILNSQNRQTLSFGVRLFKEVDRPFAFKRKLQKKEYPFNYGIGFSLSYFNLLSKKIAVGVETGQWYFINNNKNIDKLNQEYKTRQLATPILGVVQVVLYEKGKYTWVGLTLGAGMCYLQSINKLNDNSVNVFSKWTPIFQAGISLSFKFNFRNSPRYYQTDIGYTYLDKKKINTGGFDFYSIKL